MLCLFQANQIFWEEIEFLGIIDKFKFFFQSSSLPSRTQIIFGFHWGSCALRCWGISDSYLNKCHFLSEYHFQTKCHFLIFVRFEIVAACMAYGVIFLMRATWLEWLAVLWLYYHFLWKGSFPSCYYCILVLVLYWVQILVGTLLLWVRII